MTVNITNTDNAAFHDEDAETEEGELSQTGRDEVARILVEVAKFVEAGHDSGFCFDINGNKVGDWSL